MNSGTVRETNGNEPPQIVVRATEDFEFKDGSEKSWAAAEWVALNQRPNAQHKYTARFKTLYSTTGIYFLFDGSDSKLTATMTEDFDDLWTEDVFEVFLWPDEAHPIYFEYEISPLNKELPILVPNFGGKFLGWRPWNFEGERKTRTRISITGGEAKSGAVIKGWSAEVFIPFALLEPLQNVPPKPGTKWRANVYRVDYDDDQMTQWDWARVGPSFHEFKKFGTLIFE
jgi:hypothetical protein